MLKPRVENGFAHISFKGTDFRIDLKRRELIQTRLLELRKTELVLPELTSHVKDFDERMQSNFVTLMISIEQLTDSNTLWKNGIELAIEQPELFEPEYVAKNYKPDGCMPSLSSCGFCKNKECKMLPLLPIMKRLHRMNLMVVTRWVSNCIMLSRYNNDARSVINGISPSVLQFKLDTDRVGRYKWLGLKADKIFAFWVRTMSDWKFWNLDLSYFEIPVDVHIARFPFRTLMMYPLQDFDLRVVKDKELIQYFWKSGLGFPLDYDGIVWTISRNLCPNCLPTCKLNDICGKNFKINLEPDRYGILKLPKENGQKL